MNAKSKVLHWARPSSPTFVLWPFAIVAVLLRYALVPLQGGFWQDRAVIQDWAQALANHGLSSFYAVAPNPDHLPGDIIFIKMIQVLYSALGGSQFGDDFDWFARLIPIGADVGVALLLLSICVKLGYRQAGRIAALTYLFLPMSVLMSGWWTAYDSLSIMFVLAVFRCMLQASLPATALAGLLSSWVILIKPQMLIPLLPLTLFYLLRGPIKQVVKSAGAFTVAGLAWALALCSAFGLGLLWNGGQGSLVERAKYSADLWDYSTNAAPNLWSWFSVDARDSANWLLGLSHAQWSFVFLTLAAITVGLGTRRLLKSGTAMHLLALWASLGLYFSMFFLATRMHGRYALLALVLALVLSALLKSKILASVAGVILVSFLIPFFYDLSHPWDYTALRAMSVANGAGLLLTLALPWLSDISHRSEVRDAP